MRPRATLASFRPAVLFAPCELRLVVAGRGSFCAPRLSPTAPGFPVSAGQLLASNTPATRGRAPAPCRVAIGKATKVGRIGTIQPSTSQPRCPSRAPPFVLPGIPKGVAGGAGTPVPGGSAALSLGHQAAKSPGAGRGRTAVGRRVRTVCRIMLRPGGGRVVRSAAGGSAVAARGALESMSVRVAVVRRAVRSLEGVREGSEVALGVMAAPRVMVVENAKHHVQ